MADEVKAGIEVQSLGGDSLKADIAVPADVQLDYNPDATAKGAPKRTPAIDIYDDLVRLGEALPAKAVDLLTVDDLVTHLDDIIAKRVLAELTNDPTGRGYAKKTAQEIEALLNESYQMQVGETVGAVPRRPRLAELASGMDAETLAKSISALITNEFAGDPEGRGYASAQDDAARMSLLVSEWTVQETVPVVETFPARVSQVLAGVPHAPNFISADQITAILG